MQSRKKLLILVRMLNTDEDALVCDLAETYGLFSYRSLPALTVARLSAGLRENSRIKLKLSGRIQPLEVLLLAAAVDRLSLLVWSRTKDAERGKNRPRSIFDQLSGGATSDSPKAFESAEQFERRRKELILEAQRRGN